MTEQTEQFSSMEELIAFLNDHMQEPLPTGHGLHVDSITDEPIRYHQWLHRFGDKITHEHKRASDDE